jgi:hypothetical protein
VKGVTLTIEGRKFVQDAPSFEQEMYIMEQAVEAGLDQASLQLTPDEKDLEPAIKHLLIQAYKRGALFKLMAALVTEEHTEWSPEQADRNALLFQKTRDKDSKDQLRPALVGALIAFFESGVNSKQISNISSILDADSDPAPPPNSERKPVLSPEAAGALFHSAPTGRLSVKSPSTNVRSRKKSSR